MAIYRPCPNHVRCPATAVMPGMGVVEDPDSPYMNLTSEAPDPINWLGVTYLYEPPPPDSPYQWWNNPGGVGSFWSDDSQQNANDYSRNQVQDQSNDSREEPPGGTEGPIAPRTVLYGNVAVTCGVACSGAEGEFEYTVEAGTIQASTQAEADELAASLCEARAGTNPVCISTESLPGSCKDEIYDATIVATGGQPFVDAVPPHDYLFGISDGALPTGLTMDVFSGAITGTTTTAGLFTFTVEVADRTFNSNSKEYSIAVVEITTIGAMDSAIVGTAYSEQLAGTVPPGCTGTWSITGGALPDGLTLDADTGIISGPTGPDAGAQGDYSFQATLTVECE